MRSFLYFIGVLFLILAGACAIAQILHLIFGGTNRPISIGTIWFQLSANSLVGFQALIEKSAGSTLWTPLQFILSVPGWISFALPGAALLALFRRRQRSFGGSLSR